MKYLTFMLLIVGFAALTACAGGGGSQNSQSVTNMAGNWQFTMASPQDLSFTGGLRGGFLKQDQHALSGAVVYSVSSLTTISCNSGSAVITGTVDGLQVNLKASAGGQLYTLTGLLSIDGTTMTGTYSSTEGKAADGSVCGTAQSGLPWSARAVLPLTGAVQGAFHSRAGNQNFPVSGSFTQGENIGAPSATVTGTLTFENYSCLGSAAHQTVNLNGEISGNSVILQIFSDAGVSIGQIGQSLGLNSQVSPVVFESVAASANYVLHNIGVPGPFGGYNAVTKACPLDFGNVCLAMGRATDCSQPISLSPAAISFPSQIVGSTPVTQTITLTNTDPSGATLKGLSLSWRPGGGVLGFSDFNGWPNFLELDSCSTPPGSTFTLDPLQSCTVTVFFSPQQSCPWLPNAGVSPAQCPPFAGGTLPSPPALSATLIVNSSKSADGDTAFAVPIVGTGLSAITPSTPEIDFGAEALGESSSPQILSFTNQGTFPVQILGKANAQNACSTATVTLKPPLLPGDVDGLRVVQGSNLTVSAPSGRPNLSYSCDFDPSSRKPNFQISNDTCTGTMLFPGDICTLSVTYLPQPGTPNFPGLDYFLELNTLGCATNSAQPSCEIDSGRFPVELRVNPSSPLRMSPGAGLEFQNQKSGTLSDPQTITLTNDPGDLHAGTVNFQGNILSGDYTEIDDCGSSLAVGNSCTLTVTFAPASSGFRQGSIAINYTVPSQPILASPQVQLVRLRGTGK